MHESTIPFPHTDSTQRRRVARFEKQTCLRLFQTRRRRSRELLSILVVHHIYTRTKPWTTMDRDATTTPDDICTHLPPHSAAREFGRDASARPLVEASSPAARNQDRSSLLPTFPKKKKLKLHVIYHNIINLYLLYYDILDIVIGLFFL